MVTLQSSDGFDFEVPVAEARISDLVMDSVGDEDDDPPTGPISILRVKKQCLGKVIEYMEHYYDEPMNPIQSPIIGNAFDEVSQVLVPRKIQPWLDGEGCNDDQLHGHVL